MKRRLLLTAVMMGMATTAFSQGGESGLYRDYHRPLTMSDRQDIHYIISNLANNSVINIMFSKSSLERAGDRIDPVHPLQFLLCVFSNEEMKAGVHNIRGRSLLWKDFYNGLSESLQNESMENNLEPYIADFAKKLHLNPALLTSSLHRRNWNEFLDVLFIHIPRNPERNRYDD